MSGKSRLGFTLIELLIVVTIIGVLLSLLIPTISQLSQTLTRFRCKTNLKKVHQVVTSYASRYKGLLPATGAENITETAIGYGATPPDHHLMAEELKDCGARAEYFCCPAHPEFENTKEGATGYYRWENKAWKKATWSNAKWYDTPGYTWLTYSENFARHSTGNTVTPNRWATWSRFSNGQYLPMRNDQPGNPPIIFDTIKFDQKSNTYQGCWHDPHREPLSGSETDTKVAEFGGGGHTLFLAGDVIWYDVGELEAAYEQQDDIYCYFGMKPPDD
jgi:prepilin-type N-terminal cleavage/methylation domain-containing protein